MKIVRSLPGVRGVSASVETVYAERRMASVEARESWVTRSARRAEMVIGGSLRGGVGCVIVVL